MASATSPDATAASAAIQRLMERLARGETFDANEIGDAIGTLTGETASDAQRAAFLMALRVRGETIEEIAGAARALRARMLPVSAPEGTVDIVGTGGDSHGTFNVSTASAIVAAGAGLCVAKHGNRSVSSKSGASDVLQALGVRIDVGPETVAHALKEAGLGFMWAPMHHPAMKVWAAARGELKIRTLFNVLGPICNPAGVKRQVVGVFDRRWLEPLAVALGQLGSAHVWVVHGADGMDELTTTGPTAVAEWKAGALRTFEVTPEAAGLPRAHLDDLKGGDAAHNAAAITRLLDGEAGPFRDIVLFNTAAALIVGGLAASLDEGVAAAAAAIDSGAARSRLAALIAVTNAKA